MVYRIHGKIHLWPSVNYAALWMNMEERQKCMTTFDETSISKLKIFKTVCGIHGKFHLWLREPHGQYDQSWKMLEKFSDNLSYQIKQKKVFLTASALKLGHKQTDVNST
jgi:hypothetical protein